MNESVRRRGQRNVALERDIGQSIREARERAGLSVADMAERMGMQPAQVHRLENGSVIITVSAMASAARVLGVPVSTFFGQHDPLAGGNSAASDDPEEREVLEAYRALRPDARRGFLDFLLGVAAK
ncbi:helix-turn-helix transcriptional regulator [Roseospira marina]|uniref:Helix-turn-helix transcriptional regulator n=1 Tax=Roseospira marina TaxID=140057 RepID=A0A5M6IAV1_9PROT|nr:helix-turn-helix transcriptional regulator [Roseospira marina]KAA5605414.1 helix-turn-helix transcriptional regulator [Roseospira marina]MBB4314594.1 transcriptional regulator with XRE-family HTH domain [Roseospira marina]MBB5088844.1 transcriptional regulator with XRE-family HTH domain [Roseospira marina]